MQQFVADFQQLRGQVQDAYQQQGRAGAHTCWLKKELASSFGPIEHLEATPAWCCGVFICARSGALTASRASRLIGHLPPTLLNRTVPLTAVCLLTVCDAVLCRAVYNTDRVPHMNDVEAWDRVCFGRGAESDLQLPPLLADDSAEMTQLSPNICSKIMALEQVRWLADAAACALGLQLKLQPLQHC